MKPPERMSVSQLNMYHRCKRQYGYRYVCGYKSPPNWAMTAGGAVDETLNAHFVQKIKDGKGITGSTLLDLFEHTLRVKVEREEPSGEDEYDDTLKDGVKALPVYMAKADPYIEPVAVQKEVTPIIGGVPFLGFVDLVAKADGGSVAIWDNKFVSKKQPDNAAQNSLQLRTYDIALNDPIHKVGLIHLIRTKEPRVEMSTHFVTQGERSDLMRMAKYAYKLISMGAFPMVAPDNWNCSPRQCGYWTRCRGNPSGTPEPIPGEMEV